MLDKTGEWCFEGGCTYLKSMDDDLKNELDTQELEAMYGEPCIAQYD